MWKHELVVGLFPFRMLLSHFPIVPPSVRGDCKNSLNLKITKITLLSPQDDLKMSVKKGKTSGFTTFPFGHFFKPYESNIFLL